MTLKEIYQLRYLCDEIAMWEDIREKILDGGMESPKLDALPRSGIKSDPTGDKAVSAAEISKIIDELLERVQMQRLEIYRYIDSLDDSLLRQIITHRCLRLCTWEETAANIGGCSYDAIKKMFYRHFEREASHESHK